MADEYYTSNTDAPRNESMGRLQYMRSLGHLPEVPIPTWEWFAGSGRFSAAARSRGIPHLPPQDLRWGNNLGFWVHQVTALWVLLVYPVDVLFGSPNCTPWSNNARQWPEEERQRQRNREGLTLQFLAVCCFIQMLLGRSYLLEQPAGSDMFESLALAPISGAEARIQPPHTQFSISVRSGQPWMASPSASELDFKVTFRSMVIRLSVTVSTNT